MFFPSFALKFTVTGVKRDRLWAPNPGSVTSWIWFTWKCEEFLDRLKELHVGGFKSACFKGRGGSLLVAWLREVISDALEFIIRRRANRRNASVVQGRFETTAAPSRGVFIMFLGQIHS